MALETPLLDLAYAANADLSALQYHIVKIVSANTCGTTSATTDTPVGVLQNKPASGQGASVRIFGVTKCVAGAAVGAGSLVVTTAAARGSTVTSGVTTSYALGLSTDAAAADGEVFSLLLLHAGRGA